MGRISRSLPRLILFLTGTAWLAAASRHKHTHRVPIINLNGAEELIGTIREDERIVAVSPHLHIIPSTGPICRYDLSEEDGSSLFESEVLNKAEGTAEIRLRLGESIDCSDNEIHVKIVAVRCGDDSAKSESVTLKVRVQDVNNHEPEFDAPWYSFEMEEGKLGEVARLYASDKDCGHPYGKICRYEITTNQGERPLFSIDDQGVLSVARGLNRSETDSHILTVVAHDCGMLKSKSTLVTVHVLPQCKDGIQEDSIPKQLIYTPTGVGKRLLPNAKLVMCQRENTCTVKSVESKLKLKREHRRELGQDAVKNCGLSKASLSLLPRVGAVVRTERNVDEKDQEYLFDGKSNAVIVPRSTVKSLVPQRFTLTFSMKHKSGTKEEQSAKQNVLCESDEYGMNRHHFALYLRHCKLELLLRREPENSVSEFRAAEWRWGVDEVCDGEWHYYSILFSDLDNVTLLVDGNRFEGKDRTPEILDDWPLHQTKVHNTRLVVGACWHGRNEKMVQFFDGKLSSVYLLAGDVEDERVVQCLHKDPEELRFNPIHQTLPGESSIFKNGESELSLKAKRVDELEHLIQKAEYAAAAPPKGYTPAGNRLVSIETHVECEEGNKTIPLGQRAITVSVQRADREESKNMHLFISGRNVISADRRSLKVGSVMLPDMRITITEIGDDGRESDVSSKHKLDWCRVHLKPVRDMDIEYFSSPTSLIASLNVAFEHSKQGIMLKGEESVHGYTDVLQRIHYFNTRSESYEKRVYTVQCAMQGGKVVSNEFPVAMNIEGKSLEQEELGDGLDDGLEKNSVEQGSKNSKNTSSLSVVASDELEMHYEPSYDQFSGAKRLQNILEMDLPRPKALLSHHGFGESGEGSMAGGAVAIVVVVCVGFLLVLLVVGVMKMRDGPAPRRRGGGRRMTVDGMEWDDNDGTNMNITINPLEEMDKTAGSTLSRQHSLYSEEDEDEEDERGSSEEGESLHDEEDLTDDDEEEECEAKILPHEEGGRSGLEWDDSNLGALGSSSSISKQTYHV